MGVVLSEVVARGVPVVVIEIVGVVEDVAPTNRVGVGDVDSV